MQCHYEGCDLMPDDIGSCPLHSKNKVDRRKIFCWHLRCPNPATKGEKMTNLRFCIIHGSQFKPNYKRALCVWPKCVKFTVNDISCEEHARPNMFGKCIIKGCEKDANRGDDITLLCQDHTTEENILNIYGKMLCNNLDCKRMATHNHKNQKLPLYCCFHAVYGMQYKHIGNCAITNCTNLPTHNYADNILPKYCEAHKTDQMEQKCEAQQHQCIDEKINFSAALFTMSCASPACERPALFNVRGALEGMYCFDHRVDDMVCYFVKLCKFDDCGMMGKYANELCYLHRKAYSLVLNEKQCRYGNCTNDAIYGYRRYDMSRISCEEHKGDNMILKPFLQSCSRCALQFTVTFDGVKYCAAHLKIAVEEKNTYSKQLAIGPRI